MFVKIWANLASWLSQKPGSRLPFRDAYAHWVSAYQEIVGHNVEVFAVLPQDRLRMYLLSTDWWVGWELSRSLLKPLLSVFAYYFGLLLQSFRLTRCIWGCSALQSYYNLFCFPFLQPISRNYSYRRPPSWVSFWRAWVNCYRFPSVLLAGQLT